MQQARDKDIWFCTIPFTQVYNEISGRYRACCFGKDVEHETIKNTSLKEWFIDSEYMNSIRKEMLDPKSDHKQLMIYAEDVEVMRKYIIEVEEQTA